VIWIGEATNFNFHDLELGDGTYSTTVSLRNVSSQQACDINGTITINGNATFDANGKPVEVAGNWTNSGTFTHDNNTVYFDGSTDSDIITGGTGTGRAFYTLYVTKSTASAVVQPVSNDLETGLLGIYAGIYSDNGVTTTVNGNHLYVYGDGYGSYPVDATLRIDGGGLVTLLSEYNCYVYYGGELEISSGELDLSNALVMGYSGYGELSLSGSGIIDVDEQFWCASNGNGVTGSMTGGTIYAGGYFNMEECGSWTATGGTVVFDSGEQSSSSVNVDDQDWYFPHLEIVGGKTISALDDFRVAGNWTNSGAFSHGNHTVTFDGGSASIVTGGTGSGKAFYDVLCSASGTKSLGGTIDIDNDFTLNTGTWDASSSSHSMYVAGDWTSSGGSFEARSGTVYFDGPGTQQINAGGIGSTRDFYNVSVTGGGVTRLVNHMEVDRDFHVQGGTFEINNYDLYTLNAASGSASISSGAEVDLTGSSAYWRCASSNNGTLTIYGELDLNDGKVTTGSNVTLAPGGVLNQDGGSIGVGDNFTINGDYNGNGGLLRGRSDGDDSGPQITINATGTYCYDFFGDGGASSTPTILTGSHPLEVTHDVTIPSGDKLNANGVTISVAGNWTNQGAFAHGNNTVIFDGSSTIDAGGTGSDRAFYDVELNGIGATLSTTDIEIDGTLTLTSGTWYANGRDMYIGGDWINNSVFNASTATVHFDGEGEQNVTGSVVTAFYNVEVK
jgi:hypothetical protein